MNAWSSEGNFCCRSVIRYGEDEEQSMVRAAVLVSRLEPWLRSGIRDISPAVKVPANR